MLRYPKLGLVLSLSLFILAITSRHSSILTNEYPTPRFKTRFEISKSDHQKYIIFDLHYGRLNNQLRSLVRALEISKRTNRTLIVPVLNRCCSYNLLQALIPKDNFYSLIYVHDLLLDPRNPKIPYFTQSSLKPYRPNFCLEPISLFYEVPLKNKVRNTKIFDSSINSMNNSLIAMHLPFKWRVQSSQQVLSHFEYPFNIQKRVDAFMRQFSSRIGKFTVDDSCRNPFEAFRG